MVDVSRENKYRWMNGVEGARIHTVCITGYIALESRAVWRTVISKL